MKSLYDILKEDKNKQYEYEDESLISNLYLTSLSTSLRAMDGNLEKIKDLPESKRRNNLEKKYKNLQKMNKWLESDKMKSIHAINFDKIPKDQDKTSVDALILNFGKDQLSYIIELKNCSREKLIKKYLPIDKDDKKAYEKNDDKRIINKIIDSIEKINDLEIDGFDSEDVINKIHVIIVYNKRETKEETASEYNAKNPDKREVSHDETTGKQNKAASQKRNKKGSVSQCHHGIPNKQSNFKRGKEGKQKGKQAGASRNSKLGNDIVKNFGSKIQKMGFSVKSNMPKRFSKRSEEYKFSLLDSAIFKELVEDYNFFDSMNWGKYKKLF